MLELNYHLEVNTADALVLNAQQLWTGLMLRVLEPMRFTVGLEQARIEQIDESCYQRVLHFGAHEIADEVKLCAPSRVQFTTVANEQVPQGHLVYEIQDAAEGLRLHCVYKTAFPEEDNDEARQLLEMVKNAYRMADEEMLRIIREDAHSSRH